jgi:tetratricopeptide (TPR) repeat protein
LTLGLSLVPLVVPAATATSPTPAAAKLDVWNDPDFKRQYVGSYAPATEVEPPLSATDRTLTERILPLMSTNLATASRELEKEMAAAEVAGTPCGPAITFLLGNLYYQQGRQDDAGREFRKAVKAFPPFRRAHRNLGTLYAQQGHYDLALRSLTRCVELGGADGPLYGMLGLVHMAKQNYVSAASSFQSALLLQPNSTEWKTGLARALFGQRDFTAASALLGELIEQDPSKVEYWLLQANAALGMKDTARAAENFEILDRMGKATAENLSTLGDIYVNQSQSALAARAYLRAIELDPARAASVGTRAAEILAARGSTAEARTVLTAVKSAAGDQLPAADKRKVLKIEARLAMSSGNGNEAAPLLEEIVAADPLDGDAIMMLAQHYGKSGNPEKAVFLYERAANLEAFEADAKVRLAQLYVGQSKYSEAIPLLKRAQELKPRDTVLKYLEEIERISKTRR